LFTPGAIVLSAQSRRSVLQLFRFAKETFRARELLGNLTLRELRTQYRSTALGWLWSLMNPLFSAAILSLAFAVLFKAKATASTSSGLQNFGVFLLCGLLPWSAFTGGVSRGIGAIVGNAGIIKKVSFTRHLLVTATVLSGFVTLAIELSVLTVVLTLLGNPPFKTLPIVLLLMVFFFMFVLGMALALSAINVYLRDTSYLISLVFQAWFYLTPIVYPLTFLGERTELFGLSVPLRAIVQANPATRFVIAFRAALYDVDAVSARSMLSMALVGIASLAIGATVFQKLQGRFAEEL
jgi:ABC-type polysaccharide/polyol phosphate export permease